MASTLTLQSVVNLCRTHVELMPIADVGGFTNEPALSLANDTLQELLAQPFNWKFNSRSPAALLVTQMYRQDYLFAGASAFTSKGGVGIDLTTNSAVRAVATMSVWQASVHHNVGDLVVPTVRNGRVYRVISGSSFFFSGTVEPTWPTDGSPVSDFTLNLQEYTLPVTVVVKTLQAHNFSVGDTVYMAGNDSSTYNSTFTQTPTGSGWSNGWVILQVPSANIFSIGIVATDILPTSGAAGITDCSWIESCTISDVNSTETVVKPWPVKAVRTLQPSGVSGRPEKIAKVSETDSGVVTFRLANIPGSTVWAVAIVYQAKAPTKVALTDTFSPFPDEFAFAVRQMFLARCYRFLDHKRADAEELRALVMINKALGHDDTEDSDQQVSPDQTLMGDYSYGF